MLRQIECEVQNDLSQKDGVLPVTTSFFLELLFQFQNLL